MDILRVLSRGIKKSAPAAAPPQLPSAGSCPNPQFFHDDVGPARGKKRKRKGRPQHDSAAAAHDSDGDGDGDSDPALSAESHTAAPAPANPQPKPQPPTPKARLLDDDECRQTLRSHRLKLTVLFNPADQPKPPPKKAKKDKDTTAAAKPSPRKDDKKQQIYPQPLTSFSELRHLYGVSQQLAANITRQGFRVPTEVQMGSLPLLLHPETALERTEAPLDVARGVDFLAAAPTGSGKTISFLIPAIDGILRRRGEQPSDEHVLEALIVAPTRELASQIVNEGRKLALSTGVRVVLMKKSLRVAAEEAAQDADADQDADEAASDHGSEAEAEAEAASGESGGESGGESDGPSKDSPKLAKVDILVTTPKTLLNFLAGKAGASKTLPSVRSLVLDEADVLLDPLFRRQTLRIWRACTHADLALTCWSATMGSSIETLIAQQLHKQARRTDTAPKPLVRLVVGLKDLAVPNITHKLVYAASEAGKLLALRQLLHPVSSADSGPALRPPFLVFTQSIERAQALHDELKYDIPLEAGGSARVAVLHSSLPNAARSRIMARFRAGDVWVLITTDVLARGVDFAGVNGVVNYDVPTSAAAYVHRAGRTGRAGREGGVAVTLYTKDDVPYVRSVATVIAMSERQAGKEPGAGTVQQWLLDALPRVARDDKRKLKVRGVEARRTGGRATITTTSAWQRRRDNNKRGAIEGSKRRKKEAQRQQRDGAPAADVDADAEWAGLD
ncbi:P-loop containing nucleoside triphosphate hydrolase protein [Lasiosphaeria miniovina]|uniref:ATP-dependent RNA helicase n=1 Tax=Lasiosphaeria miniovina TaxID=1954250 RepID=A0AA40BIG5_9PEZI|nr:P-loop containing nucleoside triphosphate hydrolase protein [Lasiosphaeria miniovina]KAK0734804.1 P-loop containing nucleoside triphosphate hydrolase protein [Lasiosphaeria miniovina]